MDTTNTPPDGLRKQRVATDATDASREDVHTLRVRLLHVFGVTGFLAARINDVNTLTFAVIRVCRLIHLYLVQLAGAGGPSGSRVTDTKVLFTSILLVVRAQDVLLCEWLDHVQLEEQTYI
eukprot:4838879-Pleurochrysis_carterae.AAC.1